MTTAFDALYDKLRQVIPTLSGFDTMLELPDPYDIANNGYGFLKSSWGLRILDALPGEQAFDNTLVVVQRFAVVLCREVLANDGDPLPLVAAIKGLRDDVLTLQAAFYADDNLGLPDQVELIDYESTDSIVAGTTNDYRWISTVVTFNAAIRESLS